MTVFCSLSDAWGELPDDGSVDSRRFPWWVAVRVPDELDGESPSNVAPYHARNLVVRDRQRKTPMRRDTHAGLSPGAILHPDRKTVNE
jgi:hypothetical protein